MPPAKALHTDILGGDGLRLKEAVEEERKKKPMVIVLPHNIDTSVTINLLKISGVWFQ